ncbi:hypothetical protein J1N35_029797 [Gossypium stocksii]|uniref:Uncharacterized protein n=1 Tax=Gossypium stocksii TaxID=47602 RepID=A0A9D3ZTS9_9ROSI|nr:hypothetical protein J1N35_029797 [Gossypium stocksii]
MASIVTTTITNGAGQNLVLRFSNGGNPSPTIKNTQTVSFPLAVQANYLNGALVYELGSTLKWVLFWTTDNKASTKMFKISDSIDWKQVANNLKSGQMSEDMITYGDYEYTAWTSIGPNSTGQAVTANINARPVSI